MNRDELIEGINRLRKERNAVILAHLYQWPDVQDIADFVGDSLELSRKAKDTDADVIVFCGVSFMAESAKILSPEKIVLLPEILAGCPMADMVEPEDVITLRKEYPDAAVVCYVNSSAQTKANCDISCTSSNAVKICASLPNKEIIFIPDRNLGQYVASFLPDKKFIYFDGFCPTHNRIKASDVLAARASRPNAKVLVHPECTPDVVRLADFSGSTAQIIDYAVNSDAEEFIIGTEMGVLHRMQLLAPNKKYYTLSSALVCPNMKKTSLQSVYDSLNEMKYVVNVDSEIAAKALVTLDRMLAVK